MGALRRDMDRRRDLKVERIVLTPAQVLVMAERSWHARARSWQNRYNGRRAAALTGAVFLGVLGAMRERNRGVWRVRSNG